MGQGHPNRLHKQKRLKIMTHLYLLLCSLIIFASPTAAQDISSQDISAALAIPSKMASSGKSALKPSGAIERERSVNDDLIGKDVIFWRSKLLQTSFPRVNLKIRFYKDSVDIVSEDKYIIGIIANAISTPPLEGSLILIAGHTDSLGSDSYNLKLSQSRSEAIMNMLHQNYGVPKQHLIAVGFGESLPLSDTAPEDPRNRRVELFNISRIE